jgi:hypothetical protein
VRTVSYRGPGGDHSPPMHDDRGELIFALVAVTGRHRGSHGIRRPAGDSYPYRSTSSLPRMPSSAWLPTVQIIV